MDTAELRKARGAFFTPPELSRYIADWAVRNLSDSVLEPSCGEASFLLEAGAKLATLGATPTSDSNLHGVEIHEDSARQADKLLKDAGYSAEITVLDFFDYQPPALFDAIIGNPPYVRYQQHTGRSRTRSVEAALAQGVRLNGLASSWAAFVVHASSLLKADGRLGLVLPAELLSVNYAGEVRKFLLRRFAKLKLVMFERLVFPGVLEEVVLLLAEGSGGAECFELYQARDAQCLWREQAPKWLEHRPAAGAKWTPALLGPSLFSLYNTLGETEDFDLLRDWGQTYLGAVSGNNRYFALSGLEAEARGLSGEDLLHISPPGSRHLRGLEFSSAAWQSLLEAGSRGFLFYPGDRPGSAARRYIREGEEAGIHEAYKCTVRTPWWRVPLVQTPDLFLTYMDHDRPRLVANHARVAILNSLYGIVLKHGLKTLGRELLPLASLNSVTLLGSEMVGRAYGGGLLKLEPREADLLPLPSKLLLTRSRDQLLALKPHVGAALRSGHLAKAVELVDRVLLIEQLGVPLGAIQALRQGRELLFQRRAARGKGVRGEN